MVAGRATGSTLADRGTHHGPVCAGLRCTVVAWAPARRCRNRRHRALLLVWSSQTGFARELAERSAEALRGAGMPVRVRGLHDVDAALLADSQRALFIASTTGEGDPPDHALPFLRGVMAAPPSLQHLQYGVLALGDRSYGHFCGFGHQLDQWLRQHGAHPLFDAIEVDNADPAALRHWQQLLGQLGGGASELPDWSPAAYQPWTLLQREHLNPGSPGGPVYWLRLQPPAGAEAQWQAGDIAEIGPQHACASARAWLHAQGFDADTVLEDGQTLLARVARSHLLVPPGDLPALLATLQPLPHREYSIASVMADSAVELLLRRQLRADGTPGIGSGWLCDHVAIGEPVQLRLRRNDNFHGVPADVPLLLIGNGTGIAGLRAHLHERAQQAHAAPGCCSVSAPPHTTSISATSCRQCWRAERWRGWMLCSAAMAVRIATCRTGCWPKQQRCGSGWMTARRSWSAAACRAWPRPWMG